VEETKIAKEASRKMLETILLQLDSKVCHKQTKEKELDKSREKMGGILILSQSQNITRKFMVP
jgi:hypothetical protein